MGNVGAEGLDVVVLNRLAHVIQGLQGQASGAELQLVLMWVVVEDRRGAIDLVGDKSSLTEMKLMLLHGLPVLLIRLLNSRRKITLCILSLAGSLVMGNSQRLTDSHRVLQVNTSKLLFQLLQRHHQTSGHNTTESDVLHTVTVTEIIAVGLRPITGHIQLSILLNLQDLLKSLENTLGDYTLGRTHKANLQSVSIGVRLNNSNLIYKSVSCHNS